MGGMLELPSYQRGRPTPERHNYVCGMICGVQCSLDGGILFIELPYLINARLTIL